MRPFGHEQFMDSLCVRLCVGAGGAVLGIRPSASVRGTVIVFIQTEHIQGIGCASIIWDKGVAADIICNIWLRPYLYQISFYFYLFHILLFYAIVGVSRLLASGRFTRSMDTHRVVSIH